MYLSSYIQVPDNPGKIVRRKKGENIYVLYEVARVYDPKRQFNVPKRVVIGKLASDAVDAMMQPNEKFLQLFPLGSSGTTIQALQQSKRQHSFPV